MSAFDEIAVHLGAGRTLYTKARGTRFRAHVAGGVLVVESEKSGRKTFTQAQVEAAARAVEMGAPPLEDRGVQVARSWVGAIRDAMAGRPNVARRVVTRPVAPPSARATAGRRASRSGRATSSGAERRTVPARSGRSTGTGGRARPAAARRTASPRSTGARPGGDASPAEVARVIGQEIARAIASAGGRSGGPEPADLAGITERLTSLTDQLDALRAERNAAVADATASKLRARSIGSQEERVAGIATVVLMSGAEAGHPGLPAEIADLLRQAATTWRTAPGASVATSRTALEVIFRHVAERLDGIEVTPRLNFGDLATIVWDRRAGPGMPREADIQLARALHRRSSKSVHAEAGWKPAPIDALLTWSGVVAITRKVFG